MFGELVSSGGGFSLVSRTFVVLRLAWADAWWARLVCGVSLCEPVASTTDAGNITVGVPRWLLLFPSVSLPRPQPHKKIRAHPAWSVVFSRPSLVSACSCRHRAFQPCCYTTCIWWPTDRIARIILQLKAPVVSLAVSWAAGRDVPWPRRCKISWQLELIHRVYCTSGAVHGIRTYSIIFIRSHVRISSFDWQP
jgi:hypothetical protein